MDFLGTIKLVLRNLLARKGRSFLTILGIVIGVAGVIIIIALGAGAQSLILGQITKLGSNILSVQPGKSNENGPPVQVYGITITTLTNDDAEALKDKSNVPHAEAVIGLVMGSASVNWQNKNIDTNFIGTDYNFPNVINTTIQSGHLTKAKVMAVPMLLFWAPRLRLNFLMVLIRIPLGKSSKLDLLIKQKPEEFR